MFLSSSLNPVISFNYYAGTLVKESKFASFDVSLSNGTHYLVLDNSGSAAGSFSTNRNYTTCSYNIRFSDNPNYDMISGNDTLPPIMYTRIPIVINESLGFPVLVSIVVNSTSQITVFVTDSEGFRGFEDEFIADFEADPNIIDFDDILRVGGIVAVVLIIIGVIAWNYRQRQQREAILNRAQQTKELVAQRKDHRPLQTEVPPTRICSKCGHPVDLNQSYCMFCGIKFVHIKENGE